MSRSSAASCRTRRPEDAGVVGIVGDDGHPLEDEAKVGHEDAPDKDETEHDGDAHEHRDEDETEPAQTTVGISRRYDE